MVPRVFIVVALLAVIAVALAAQTVPQKEKEPRTITVTGSAERQVPPDLGFVVLAVQTQADRITDAVANNSTQSSAVIAAINTLKISGMTVRTLGFNVEPMYEQPAPNQAVIRPLRIIGYQVTNQVEVRLPQPTSAQLSAAVSQVIDAGLTAGANRMDSVRFDLANPQPIQREILAAATHDAIATARTLAHAAGVTLGPLLSLSANPSYTRPPMPMMAMGARAMAAPSVPIEAGPLTVMATVNAVYQIENASASKHAPNK